MKFYEYGDKNLPHIMLIIDGHGEEGNVPYTSTEKIANHIPFIGMGARK